MCFGKKDKKKRKVNMKDASSGVSESDFESTDKGCVREEPQNKRGRCICGEPSTSQQAGCTCGTPAPVVLYCPEDPPQRPKRRRRDSSCSEEEDCPCSGSQRSRGSNSSRHRH